MLVPLLVLIGVQTHTAIGSSLAYIVFTGISGAYQHRRLGSCEFKLVLPVVLGGVFTAQIGAIMTSYLQPVVLQWLLAIILLVTSIRMLLFQRHAEADDTSTTCPPINMPVAITMGAIVGLLSGLLGVGGGFLLVPLMMFLMKVSAHVAIGSSLLQVVGLASSGTIRHLLLGNVDGQIVAVLVAGGVVFAQLGARLCRLCPQQHLQRIFALVLLLFAIRLLLP